MQYSDMMYTLEVAVDGNSVMFIKRRENKKNGVKKTTAKKTAAKAADGSAKVSDVFDTAQKTSVDTLKNLGLSVKE